MIGSGTAGEQETRIQAEGTVDKDTGRFFFSTKSPWEMTVNDFGFAIHEAESESQTCQIDFWGTRMTRLTRIGPLNLLNLGKEVWEYLSSSSLC